METNKEITIETMPPFLYTNGFNAICIGYNGDTEVTDEWNKWKKEFLEHHLSKQAEYIAEKAEHNMKEENSEMNYETGKPEFCNTYEDTIESIKQSILQASKEYINNLNLKV